MPCFWRDARARNDVAIVDAAVSTAEKSAQRCMHVLTSVITLLSEKKSFLHLDDIFDVLQYLEYFSYPLNIDINPICANACYITLENSEKGI